jgi:RNA polymerase sigma-70 factor (ECF subfamily)
VASGPNPEQPAVAASEASRLSGCLDTQEENLEKSIRGAYLNRHTYADWADRFGVPLNSMRGWLRRGVIALRECMSQ